MPKPDSALLDLARYAHSCSIPTRYGDLDPNRHINNVGLIRILEDARLRFILDCKQDGSTLYDWQIMTASLSTEFLGQSYYPEPMDVKAAFSHIGNSSFTMLQLALQQARPVALVTTVIVWVVEDRPIAIPDTVRTALAPYMLRP